MEWMQPAPRREDRGLTVLRVPRNEEARAFRMATRSMGGQRNRTPSPGMAHAKGAHSDDGGSGKPATGGGRGGPRRRRSRHRGAPQPSAPEAVIAQVAHAESAPDLDKAPEEPLTPDELALMQQHFRFLREYRKVLHLRVNAHEDLLLNEKRLPTRRGVCQHLLSKVDRARVFAAAERLEPAVATRFAEGVLRISPDLDHLLLYLQCVGRSASQQQAVSALAQALSAMDIGQLSRAQMRRVLDLILELFDERQRPQVLLGLLDNPGFRRVFDDSLDEFPQTLVDQVAPLRAVQLVIFRGERNTLGAEVLERGLGLLMVRGGTLARRCSVGAKWRLAECAVESEVGMSEEAREELWGLVESLSSDNAERHAAIVMAWARRLIARGDERYARKLLTLLTKAAPDQTGPGKPCPGKSRPEVEACRRWLSALDAPRWGRVAVLRGESSGSRGAPPARAAGGNTRASTPSLPFTEQPRGDGVTTHRRPGVFLDNMQSVHVIHTVSSAGAPDELGPREVPSIPGLAPIWVRGISPDGQPFLAVPRLGRGLVGVVNRRPGPQPSELLQICFEAVSLLSALAEAGLGVPDAAMRRFEVSDTGRIWYVDPHSLRSGTPSDLRAEHGRLAADFCSSIVALPQSALLASELRGALGCTGTASEVAMALSTHCVALGR